MKSLSLLLLSIIFLVGPLAHSEPTTNTNYCILENGNIFCRAENTSNDINTNTYSIRLNFIKVEGIETNQVSSLLNGPTHTCVILKDTTAQCWGQNDKGKLGNGNDIDQLAPVFVKSPERNEPLTGIIDIQMFKYATIFTLASGEDISYGKR